MQNTAFDLVAYANQHRYRLRNLHDGNSVPPAISRKPCGGYPGEERWDAIVGHSGYVAMNGNKLTVVLFYKSGKGVKRAIARLEEMGGQLDQVGDIEIGATTPTDRIEDVLRLIKVSKLQSGDVSRFGAALGVRTDSRIDDRPSGVLPDHKEVSEAKLPA